MPERPKATTLDKPKPTEIRNMRKSFFVGEGVMVYPLLQPSKNPTSNDSDKVAVTRRGQQLFPELPPPPSRDDNTRKRFNNMSLGK
jgi:hypothetical protein